jgi:hypothetical protein
MATMDFPHVMAEIDAGGFVIVDDPDLSPHHLREPDRGGPVSLVQVVDAGHGLAGAAGSR